MENTPENIVKTEDLFEKRTQKFFNWLKNPYNLGFVLILIIGIIIRLYYFNINTGVWWDELEYLSTGKVYAGTLDYALSPNRAIFFPLMLAVIFVLHGTEFWARVFLELLPSIGILVGTYLLGKELFDKKIGLISMAIMAVFYEHLFDMARLLSDMLANFLELACILTFWIFYVKGKNKKLLFVPVILGFLGMMTRHSVALSLIAIICYLFITERFSMFKNKNVWIAFFVGLLCLSVYMIYNVATFGSPLPAVQHYLFSQTEGVAAIAAEHGNLNFSYFNSIYSWLFWPLAIFLIIGFYMFLEVLLVGDKIIKEKNITPNPKLLLFLWVIISSLFWIFIFHFTTTRWPMGLAPAIFVIVAYGMTKIYSLFSFLASFITKSKNLIKVISVLIILLLFSYGLFLEIKTADSIIKNKKDSYAQVKDISLWLKDNTKETDNIIFDSQIWYTYYVQRNNSLNTNWGVMPQNYDFKNMSWVVSETPYNFVPMCEYDFDFTLNRTNKTYLVWSVYEQVYTAKIEYLQKNMELGVFTPVNVFYIGEQISAVILKIDQNKLKEKLSTYDYSNQLIPATVQETQSSWDAYKKQKGISEKDICSFKG